MASLIEARREVTGEEETEGESPKNRTGDRGERHQRTRMYTFNAFLQWVNDGSPVDVIYMYLDFQKAFDIKFHIKEKYSS